MVQSPSNCGCSTGDHASAFAYLDLCATTLHAQDVSPVHRRPLQKGFGLKERPLGACPFWKASRFVRRLAWWPEEGLHDPLSIWLTQTESALCLEADLLSDFSLHGPREKSNKEVRDKGIRST